MLLLLALAKPSINRKKLGFALNFCPVCRCVTCCRAVELKLMAAMTWSNAAPQRLSHEMTCTACQTAVEIQGRPVTGSKKLVEDVRAGLDALLSDEAGPLRARMDLEERVEGARLNPTERRDLIAEPFITLDYSLTRNTKHGAHHAVSQLAQFCLTVATVASVIGWLGYSNEHGALASKYLIFSAISTSAAVGLLAFMVHRTMTGARRVAARMFVPRIAHSLKPLAPTGMELEQALTSLRARGLNLAKRVEPSQLEAAMGASANTMAMAA